MRKIWKSFSGQKVESYQFPNTEELQAEQPEEIPAEEPVIQDDLIEEESLAVGSELAEEPPKADPPPSYASLHSDMLLQESKAQAESILEQARRDAEELRENARREGYAAGYDTGYSEGTAEGRRAGEEELEAQRLSLQQEEQELTDQVAQFLKEASDKMDQRMDESVPELRDLAITVAEKVIGISLNSSSEVIERMIRMAVDKRKRREWVQIYVSKTDAQRLSPLSASLTTTLSTLSDRIRIIPMNDDEPGACIIEMPDEIVDASVSTQINNIRAALSNIPADPH